ncbi:trehalose-phosphatase [Halopseudomonas nanhaiensis]|uniref:trehalose-phosphatase n=1 Tax=Halopseudomonas nanhaiensis TaxID=2830842 RepID=UPI001CBEDC4B|nr:trehalose-phosphatase [Halopseudomonas nanhaiensis]UAW98825.1 trehalose-phosphatase [Halopseudomonas nanhaiensis]
MNNDALAVHPPHASLDELIERFGPSPALFLDYDGTLAAIQATPDQAKLEPHVRQALEQLARRHPVAIVSGRERTDVEQLVGLPGLIYAGSHGLDIAGPGVRWDAPEAGDTLPVLDSACEQLQAETSRLDGILIERKRYAVAVHYRLADDETTRQAERAVEQLAGTLVGLKLAHGKKVWELRPDIDWDKGRAIDWLCSQLRRSAPGSFKPVFLGDDETDEDGFIAVAALGGVGVLVADAERSSAASMRVTSVGDVANLLDALSRRS